MSSTPFQVLFLCTGNSARSILAESLLNHLGQPRYAAFSAGSQPKTAPNPLALATLASHGHNTKPLRSKSWNEFGAADAPTMDIVITVCGNAAVESCPAWPGSPLKAHWGFEDPSDVDGDSNEQRAAFETTYHLIKQRIQHFLTLPIEQMSRAELQQALNLLGRANLTSAIS